MRTSVVIPTHQSARYLREALDSIASQTLLPDEVIISDDRSSDDTGSIAKKFSQRVSFPVYWLDHSPSGITNNYLNAVARTSGDIIVVGDHDDVWLENRIETLVRYFSSSKETVLVSADSALVDSALNPLNTTLRGGPKRSARLSKKANRGDNFLFFLRGGLPFLAHTLSFRSSIKGKLLQHPEHIRDWWFEEWATCIAACHGRLGIITDCLTLYRQHNGQTTRRVRSESGGMNPTEEWSYMSRIERMEYCVPLLTTDPEEGGPEKAQLQRKRELLKQYISFLRRREALRTDPKASHLLPGASMLLTGEYNKFARGVLSAGSDITAAFTSWRRIRA